MAFTFTINSNTYTSDPTNTGVPAAYHFDGYNYLTALGNLAVDIVAVAAAAIASAAAAAVSESNAAASAASAAAIAGAFVGTSTTSWTPAVETKAFTTQANEQYSAGVFVTIVSQANGANNGYGQVVSYAGTTLTVDVQVANGSGAHTDWNISIAGVRGPEGTVDAATLAGGATQTTSAVDIILTSASTRVQIISMTATGKALLLPDATTLSEGGALFVVKNTGDYAFAIRGSTSMAVYTSLSPGRCVGLYLTDNATVAGTWAVDVGSDIYAQLVAGTVTTINAAADNANDVCALTATAALVAYVNAAGHLNYRVLTVTGNTFAVGAAMDFGQISTTGESGDIRLARLADTQAVALYANYPATYPEAHTVNVSGTTVTTGTVQVLNAVASTRQWIAALSATQAVAVYRSTSGYCNTCTVNISGTSVSAGANAVVNAVASDYLCVSGLSSTLAVVAYKNGTTTFGELAALSVSGTTVTPGAPVAVTSTITNYTRVVNVTATRVLFSSMNNSGYIVACLADVSGTTVTAVAAVITLYNTTTVDNIHLKRFSATRFLISCAGGSNYALAIPVHVSGDAITTWTTKVLNAVSSAYVNADVLSEGAALVVMRAISTYCQGVVLETET